MPVPADVQARDKLKARFEAVRIGGAGTARRKKLKKHGSHAADEKKMQVQLKRLGVNIPGVEEVNMFKEDGTVIHFATPKVQASVSANTYTITGHGENKRLEELLPGIINQLGPDTLMNLKRIAEAHAASEGATDAAVEDDDVPEIGENFDAASEGATAAAVEDDDIPEICEHFDAASECSKRFLGGEIKLNMSAEVKLHDRVEALSDEEFFEEGIEYFRKFDQGIVIVLDSSKFWIKWDRTGRISAFKFDCWQSHCKVLGQATPSQIAAVPVLSSFMFEQAEVNTRVEALCGGTFSHVEYYRKYDRGTVSEVEAERLHVTWDRTGLKSNHAWFVFEEVFKIVRNVVINAVITTEAELVTVETSSMGGEILGQYVLKKSTTVVDLASVIKEMVACWSSTGDLVDQESCLADYSQLTITLRS